MMGNRFRADKGKYFTQQGISLWDSRPLDVVDGFKSVGGFKKGLDRFIGAGKGNQVLTR